MTLRRNLEFLKAFKHLGAALNRVKEELFRVLIDAQDKTSPSANTLNGNAWADIKMKSLQRPGCRAARGQTAHLPLDFSQDTIRAKGSQGLGKRGAVNVSKLLIEVSIRQAHMAQPAMHNSRNVRATSKRIRDQG